jgi:TPP-dependent pyruvate/acetoin dehydrogenase alpha subunit
MNFAGALKLPVVFVCQNNHWAISVPRHRQTASETFAQKGLAYGAHVVQIDGNDIFAYHKVASEARARALEDGRPTLIEGITYRLGDHTTADDARRYRDAAELESWLARDPISRVRKHLERRDLWSDEKESALQKTVKQRVDAVIENAMNIAEPDAADFFDDMFATLPADLAAQRDRMTTHSLGLDPDQERLSGGRSAHHAGV